MTDGTPTKDPNSPPDKVASGNSKPRSKGGVPRVPLATAELYARAIWNTARRAEAIPVAVARAISGKADSKADGGAWRTKAASLRVFSLVARLNNENLKLSEIGLSLVDESNPDGQEQARRQAVLSVPSYLKLLTDHNGNPLPTESTVATTFEFQYELPTASAKEAAEVFAESVKHAGLIDANGNIRIDPDEAPAELEPEISTMPKAAKVEVEKTLRPPEAREASAGGAAEPTLDARARFAGSTVSKATFNTLPPTSSGPTPPVGVEVTIDMSKWQADDVLRVLAALGYEAPNEPE